MRNLQKYFHNKSIAITGGSSGLGKELACYLAQYQVKLFLIARNTQRLKKVAEEIKAFGSQATIIKADISQQEDGQKLIQALEKDNESLDFLFLNAGIGMWQKFSEVEDENYFQKLMDTNYFGVLYPLYYGIDYFKRSNTKIAVTLSVQAYLGVPYHTGYVAAKHAVNGLIDSLLLEENLKIIKIIPGWIRGTELRAKALSSQKGNLASTEQTSSTHTQKTKNNLFSTSLEKGVLKVVDGLLKGKKKIHLPEAIKYVYWLNYFFPNAISKKIKKAVNKE